MAASANPISAIKAGSGIVKTLRPAGSTVRIALGAAGRGEATRITEDWKVASEGSVGSAKAGLGRARTTNNNKERQCMGLGLRITNSPTSLETADDDTLSEV
jgi:hypothetical protein